ncbi:hypothetical protein F5Y13DRAFT_204459 [Hypoxylon sp. FL1857]|nr:hypothetical protein F5Y13DRAFT_204459 [Hypoxylon sp. FL1857]
MLFKTFLLNLSLLGSTIANPLVRSIKEDARSYFAGQPDLDTRADNTGIECVPRSVDKRDGGFGGVESSIFSWRRDDGFFANFTDDDDESLARRSISGYGSMDQPENGKLDEWFARQWKLQRSGGIWEVPHVDREVTEFGIVENDESTADFLAFKNHQFTMGVKGMCGCTSVVILSKVGAYMTHFWQRYFDSNEVSLKAFQSLVIDELKGTSKRGNRIVSIPELPCESRENPSANDIQVAIYTPFNTADPSKYAKYPDHVERIKQVLVEEITGLKKGDIKVVGYVSREKVSNELDKSDGKLVVVYDPEVEKGKAAYMMWAGSLRDESNPHKVALPVTENNKPVLQAKWNQLNEQKKKTT